MAGYGRAREGQIRGEMHPTHHWPCGIPVQTFSLWRSCVLSLGTSHPTLALVFHDLLSDACKIDGNRPFRSWAT
jgi:hypothetical protein